MNLEEKLNEMRCSKPMLHSMQCSFPEGCSCGAAQFNKLANANSRLVAALEHEIETNNQQVAKVFNDPIGFQKWWDDRRSELTEILTKD